MNGHLINELNHGETDAESLRILVGTREISNPSRQSARSPKEILIKFYNLVGSKVNLIAFESILMDFHCLE